MEEQAVLEIRHVSKTIGSKKIIQDLSFEVYPGEVFGFLGPNGAGKTTLIRMIVGLMKMNKGDILIHGQTIKGRFEEAIRHVGAIVENPEMYKFLSGKRNLLHYARMFPGGIPQARISEVVELVGLKNRINEKVKTYSLGMRQRLGVAQALLHRPSLLILDEPTNGLDPAGIRELRDYLRRLAREEGIAIVVSSHLLSEMELMCDRVAIIQQGKLIDIQNLRGEGAAEAQTSYFFEVNDPAVAQAIVQEVDPALPVVLRPDGIEISAGRERAADIGTLLVQAGLRLYTMKPLTQSLEDKFLKITGSDQIA
ncbi:ABC transporter ATP-binding protein [Paenibacillus lutrae]|uniref:ATP-binding cassette domain-containing protein n=1 Tax=Paenibacillus lutrae TaxID=2078573 RepID=A0A7X3FFB6_9BACL|nr:ABC transporter ATP-binding protein [Paenibacillus lutrae]MVO98669.1 ATP-binding cassette domain-containing protein [Paenibacillus lutrae]